ncbi:PAX-interacting protein 1 [Rhynchospora pubera]|uniref:PAX-interacting protein 1 n=1 Tax=Rhynchospora pubera TaxID=906938 RepID=A0AAV8ECS3_9POAL|nr:PAX-interacting protein 1 [Rhynchospora pubera]
MEGENENSPPTRKLNFLMSQEPDEQSQADALNAVDRFLLFEEEEEKENSYHGLLHNNSAGMVIETNSELNLSAKVVKYLSNNQHQDKCSVRKLDVFDWVDTSSQEEGNICLSYDVGPATQMAAEVLEELFHAPPPKSAIDPNKTKETNMGNEIKGSKMELCVFEHPKRRRSIINTTLRQSAQDGLDGCVSDRLPLIMDTVKRKKRSPFVRRSESKHGNLRLCTKVRCEESDKVSRLRERNAGGFDSVMGFSMEIKETYRRPTYENCVDSNMNFSNKRINRSRGRAIRVIFSQSLDPKILRQQKKILLQFGASTVLSMSDATHFIADRFGRTKNMLEAIAMGRHVVRSDWINSCAKAGCFVSEEKFVLRDLKKEREIGFSMPKSIQQAKRFPLLEGWRVLITPKARPEKELLKSLVKASRGQLVERLTRYTMEDEDNFQGNFFIISCKEDYQICSPLLSAGIKAYDSELLLNGIVTQKLEFKRHLLFAGKS